MTPGALNYHHLLYFWAVAKEGSLRRASEVLHVSQPSISAQLKQLEESFGSASFHAYDSEVNPDGYLTKGSGVRRRNLFLGPRAVNRSSSGARGTSSSFACRCCRFGAENNRTPAPYPGLRTWPLGARDLSRRFAGRTHNAARRPQIGCGPGGRTFHEPIFIPRTTRFCCTKFQDLLGGAVANLPSKPR